MSDLKVEVAQQHVYTPSVSSAPLYRYKQVHSNTQFAGSMTNVTTAVFDIPLEVINLSKSYIEFDLKINDNGDMTADRYIVVANGALNPIRSMLIKGSNSSYDFMNVQNMQAYSRMLPFELSKEEFDKLPEDGVLTAAGSLYSQGFGWMNLEHTREDFKLLTPDPGADDAAAIRAAVQNATVAWQGTYKYRLENSQVNLTYDAAQPAARNVPGGKIINRIIHQEAKTATDGTATTTIKYKIPGFLLKNSLMSLDKDIYTANERLQLEIQMAPYNSYVSLNEVKANIDEANTIDAIAVDVCSISNFHVQFAQQDNRLIAEQIKSLVNSVGIRIPYHYLTQTRFVTANATDFRYSSTLRGDQGSFCHCVYNLICPQNDDELAPSLVYNVGNAQWVSRRSQVNGMYLQDTNQSTYQEWMALKCNNHNGIIERYGTFQENACIVDRFDSTKSDPHSLTGLPLQVGKATDYSIDITTAGNAIRTYWFQPVFIRMLNLTPMGVSVSS